MTPNVHNIGPLLDHGAYSFISNKQGGRLLIFQQFATQDGPYSIPPVINFEEFVHPPCLLHVFVIFCVLVNVL